MRPHDLSFQDVRMLRLLGRVANMPTDARGRHKVAPFFVEAGPEIGDWQGVMADLHRLQKRDWIHLPRTLHWETEQVAALTADGREALEEFGLLDRDRSQERTACRRRLATWLDANPPKPDRGSFLDSPEGQWLARPFDARIVDQAADWLVDEGFARRDGILPGMPAPRVLDLTPAGQAWLDGDRPDSGGHRFDIGPGGVVNVVDRSPGSQIGQHGHPRGEGDGATGQRSSAGR